MRLYLPRFHVRALDANLETLRRDVAQAAAEGSATVVFPELFLTGYTGSVQPRIAHEVFAELSSAHPGMLCFFGSLSETDEDGKPVNRSSVYLDGQPVLHYDKVQLFRPNGEHEMWQPGEQGAVLRWRDWRIGLLICNDLRFAALSMVLNCAADINLLVYPSLWPWQRDDVFAALLRGRAIENGCFAVGQCVAGVDLPGELFDGAGTHVFDPLGRPVYPRGRVYELDPAAMASVMVDTARESRAMTEVRVVDV